MRIEMRELAAIRPYDKNPRKNEEAVDAVAQSIKEFGFRQPIVVDADGVIICGHTRYKAALKLGLEKVPVHVAKDLTPEQIRAYRIADNRTASLSSWDFELLPIELEALQNADYDVTLTGFSEQEIARILAPNEPHSNQPRDVQLESVWAVVVECTSEDEQRAVYERLTQEGLRCRLLIA